MDKKQIIQISCGIGIVALGVGGYLLLTGPKTPSVPMTVPTEKKLSSEQVKSETLGQNKSVSQLADDELLDEIPVDHTKVKIPPPKVILNQDQKTKPVEEPEKEEKKESSKTESQIQLKQPSEEKQPQVSSQEETKEEVQEEVKDTTENQQPPVPKRDENEKELLDRIAVLEAEKEKQSEQEKKKYQQELSQLKKQVEQLKKKEAENEQLKEKVDELESAAKEQEESKTVKINNITLQPAQEEDEEATEMDELFTDLEAEENEELLDELFNLEDGDSLEWEMDGVVFGFFRNGDIIEVEQLDEDLESEEEIIEEEESSDEEVEESDVIIDSPNI